MIRGALVLSVFLVTPSVLSSELKDIEFETSFLSSTNSTIDLSRFSKVGYIMPGTYDLTLNVNGRALQTYAFKVVEFTRENNPMTEVCMPYSVLTKLGLNQAAMKKVTYSDTAQCADLDKLAGVRIEPDMSRSRLNVLVPQGYLEYSDPFWDPPSQWDDGVAGMLLDYNLSFGLNDYRGSSGLDKTVSGYGVVGANWGAWRVRSDWQANWAQRESSEKAQQDASINRVYAYRALPDWQAKLSVGEDYLQSSVFNGFRYMGVSLSSDERMLPPNARNYSSEVVGVARTDAKVVVSQDGRVLHEERVIAGPFRLDIRAAVKGVLDVKVEEQDGQVQSFQVNTLNAPYLSRPGQVRYNMALGRPATMEHKIDGASFMSGDLSVGVARNLSLLGGAQLSKDYQSVMLGTGYDFLSLGALSLQHYQSWANIAQDSLRGSSYSVNYAKDFSQINSRLALASYRYADKDYMSMSDYISHTSTESPWYRHDTGMRDSFTVSFNTQYDVIGASSYVSLDQTNYRDGRSSSRYNLSLSKGWSFDAIKWVNTNLSFYRTNSDSYGQSHADTGGYLSLSLPLSSGFLNYSGSANKRSVTHTMGYSAPVGENGSMSLSSSVQQGESPSFNGNYAYRGDVVDISTNIGHLPGSYTDVGMTLRGGATATRAGAGIHSISQQGGSRMLVDSNGIADIKLRNGGRTSTTNSLGVAVTTDTSPYTRQRIEVDLDALPEEANISQSVGERTLTEGAIGYWKLGVRAGKQVMAMISLGTGHPPFGASVINHAGVEIGIVTEDGMAYISGFEPEEVARVVWGDKQSCALRLPAQADLGTTVNLGCISTGQ